MLRNLKNLNHDSASFLDTLAKSAYHSISEGYYKVDALHKSSRRDLTECILKSSKNAVITEVKFASPSYGKIQCNLDVGSITREMVKGGAIAISVLTEPKYFNGSLSVFTQVRQSTNLPLLMKDIIVSNLQLDAACILGADAILLIYRLFDMERCESSIEKMISYAHSKDLQVLLEVHSKDEFKKAVETEADLVGINNRDFDTLSVDIHTTLKILESAPKKHKLVISESGIKKAEDIRLLKKAGADAFLIGTTVMKSEHISSKVKEMVEA